jgi:hypothetical protein
MACALQCEKKISATVTPMQGKKPIAETPSVSVMKPAIRARNPALMPNFLPLLNGLPYN